MSSNRAETWQTFIKRLGNDTNIRKISQFTDINAKRSMVQNGGGPHTFQGPGDNMDDATKRMATKDRNKEERMAKEKME